MKRRKLISLIVGLAIAWPLASYAQEPKRPLKRVGILTSFVSCPLQPDNLIVRRLGELGWIEGQNFVFDCESTVGRIDQVPALARELVSRRPNVLTVGHWSIASALKQEAATLPIVIAKPSDLPVEQGIKLILTINLKTAKELGLTVPPSLIARADEAIE